jgi:hypothetical protein
MNNQEFSKKDKIMKALENRNQDNPYDLKEIIRLSNDELHQEYKNNNIETHYLKDLVFKRILGKSEGTLKVTYFTETNHGNYVIKVLKPSLPKNLRNELTLLKDVAAQRLSRWVVSDFNEYCKKHNIVSDVEVLSTHIFKTKQQILDIPTIYDAEGHLMYQLETKLYTFKKYSSNDGFTDEDDHIYHALSHFSLLYSGCIFFLIDLQGSPTNLTDLQIHTYSGGFHSMDRGKASFRKFIMTHTCNDYCRKLNLPDLTYTNESTKKMFRAFGKMSVLPNSKLANTTESDSILEFCNDMKHLRKLRLTTIQE